jgi:hypothetical protein
MQDMDPLDNGNKTTDVVMQPICISINLLRKTVYVCGFADDHNDDVFFYTATAAHHIFSTR